VGRYSSNLLSGPIERGNDELIINGEDSIGDGAENHFHFSGSKVFFRFHVKPIDPIILHIANIISVSGAFCNFSGLAGPDIEPQFGVESSRWPQRATWHEI
jgi:hypothetical protein